MSTNFAEEIDRLMKQSAMFGNPRGNVSDRGSAFTSAAFDDYCTEEEIQHVLARQEIREQMVRLREYTEHSYHC